VLVFRRPGSGVITAAKTIVPVVAKHSAQEVLAVLFDDDAVHGSIAAQ
jgi:hypothetical protein